MGLYIAISYVDVTDEDRRIGCGDDHPYETAYDKPGDLFRALQGRSPSRPWEQSMGRCTGKVYVDRPQAIAGYIGETDSPTEMVAVPVGWVFLSRQPYDDDKSKTWLREAWVTVHTGPDTVTRTPHYASLEG